MKKIRKYCLFLVSQNLAGNTYDHIDGFFISLTH
jgi:hypothetical protein